MSVVIINNSSTQEKLEVLVKASQAFQEQPTEMEALWNSCSGRICSLEDKQKQLGLGDKVGLRFSSIFCNFFSGISAFVLTEL